MILLLTTQILEMMHLSICYQQFLAFSSVLCAPAIFSAKTMLAELKANEQLLQARNMDPKLANGLTQQATFKVSKMHGMTSPDVVMQLDHLKASKLPETMVNAITMELDNLMMGNNNNAMKVSTTASACDWLNKYLTHEEWCQLEATNAWQGCLVLAKRLRALGIKSIKESTKRAGVAILLCIQASKASKDASNCRHTRPSTTWWNT